MTNEAQIVEQATRWHLASARDDMDWLAFTAWLEADPAHARIYDEIALSDAALTDHHDTLLEPESFVGPANDDVPVGAARFSWKRWGAGGTIAASLMAIIGLTVIQPEPAAVYHTQDQSMTIALTDGSQVTLAPASELTVERDGQKLALIGGAYFDVAHDPDRQLTIAAGGLTVSDIGTKFDLQAVGKTVRLAVNEGSINVESPRLATPLELDAGHQLIFDGEHGRSRSSSVEIGTVGGWRTGELTYTDTSLALVSADLRRYAGVELEVPGKFGNRMFSGTLSINDGSSAVRDLSQLMGLEFERIDGGYRLRAPAAD